MTTQPAPASAPFQADATAAVVRYQVADVERSGSPEHRVTSCTAATSKPA